MRHLRFLIWPGLVVASSLLTALAFAGLDAAQRTIGHTEPFHATLSAIASLYSASALVAAVAVAACVLPERLLCQALSRRKLRYSPWFSALWYSILTTLATWDTAASTFSGNRIKSTPYAVWGPFAMVGVMCAGVLVGAWLLNRAVRLVLSDRRAVPLVVAALFLGAAALLTQADLRLFVGLYSSLHVLLEMTAALLSIGALLVVLLLLAQSWPRTLLALTWTLTSLAIALAVQGLALPESRARLDDTLGYAWQEELYLGRVLRRLAMVEAYATRNGDWQGVELARLDSLRVRFALRDSGRSARWNEPWYEPPQISAAVAEIRGQPRAWNVLVFYVDTLRFDTSNDVEAMPNAVGFGADNIRFERAYASGSDTIRSLPGITGGNYDFSVIKPGDLLQVARAAGMKRVLAIGDSAQTFLKAHRPEFAFDQTMSVHDHAPEKQVWGYGADRVTSEVLVDKTLEWIDNNRGTPFLAWVLTYDQHAWQELDVPFLKAQALRLGLPTSDGAGKQHWRYRVVARLVDEQFGRLLRGLDRLGVAEETIVLFLSDHGESLGREGFWAHSVFLWEELVRVPLMLRIPGLEATSVPEAVSLIDVAPTLARYLLADPPLDDYSGEDLLSQLVPGRPLRRNPIVMAATAGLTLSRVGVIDESGRWKLVVPFGTSRPELYDLASDDVDRNIAKRHPNVAARLLGEAVGCPLFPRKLVDFQAFVYH